MRTPLGRVLLARLRGHGAIEVAGPSAAAEVRAVSDAMLAHGAEQVLIDGAIDRRAASSPAVADGLIVATGAVLGEDIEEVVSRTARRRRARAPADDAAEAARDRSASVRGSANGLGDGTADPRGPRSARALPPRFVLTRRRRIDGFLRDAAAPRWLLVAGALPEPFSAASCPAPAPPREP